MPTKYLYVDDDLRPVGSHLQLLKKVAPSLTIEPCSPTSLGDLVTRLIGKLKEEPEVAHGLLLDWRLSDVPPSSGKPIDFRFAGTLAQELRTRANDTDGADATDVPIVLFSSDEKLKASFFGDGTSEDLFDEYVSKERLPQAPEEIAEKLIALAEGYAQLRVALQAPGKPPSLAASIARYPSALMASWDSRIDNALTFGTRGSRVPPHRVARFLRKELLDQPGPLIDELMLAAFLGVDRSATGKAWGEFLVKNFEQFQYSGPFASAWHRWWSDGVYRWWSDRVDGAVNFSSLDAGARVDALKSVGISGLVAAKPIDEGQSSRFDTVCTALNLALDSTEGFRLASADLAPWQYPRYLSRKAVRDRTRYEELGLHVHPMDVPRVKSYLATLA